MTILTFGSGGTYADFAAAWAAVPSTLADDYTIQQVGNVASASSTPYTPKALGGFTLTVENASPHGGDPTTGYTISGDPSGACVSVAVTGVGSVEIKDLNLNLSGSNFGDGILVVSAGPNVNVHDCISHSTRTSAACFNIYDTFGASGSTTIQCWNLEASGAGIGFSSNIGYSAVIVYENCTAHDNTTNGFSLNSAAVLVRNCSATGSATCYTGQSGATAVNCAASDTTASTGWSSSTGAQDSIVAATEFASLSYSSSDFLKVTGAGVLGTGGASTTIAGNTAGIRGNARPGTDSQYSIGADELVPISTVTVTSCSPNDGAAAGGTPVTVYGTGFVATPTVTFGGASATSVVWVSATELTCVTPAGAGVVNVVVTNPDTGSGTLVGGFSYIGAAEEGIRTPVEVPARIGEGGAGVFRSSPGLGDVLNKLAVCLQFIQTSSQEGSFAEFKTAMEDLVPPTYAPRPRYVTAYPGDNTLPIQVPNRTGEGQRTLNRAQTSSLDLVALKEVLDRAAQMIQDIQAASQLADFAAFKAALATLPVLTKSDDSRV